MVLRRIADTIEDRELFDMLGIADLRNGRTSDDALVLLEVVGGGVISFRMYVSFWVVECSVLEV